MPKIKIESGKIGASIAAALPAGPDKARLIRGLAAAAMANWKGHAQRDLKTTRRDYVAGIQEPQIDGAKAEIHLVGRLPNMVEQGWGGGDQRAWMLQSPKAKTSKEGGKYLIVPFRHAASTSSGANTGRVMPRSIHMAAKQLAPTIGRPSVIDGMAREGGKGTQWGERLHAHAGVAKAAQAILGRTERVWHATSIYQGIVRQEKTYEQATQSQYTSFRVISSNVNRSPAHFADRGGEIIRQGHWVHPGLAPRRYAERTQSELGAIMSRVVDAVMGKAK